MGEIRKMVVNLKILIVLSEKKPHPLLKSMKSILHHSNLGEQCFIPQM